MASVSLPGKQAYERLGQAGVGAAGVHGFENSLLHSL